jgi:hypothetical protein
VLNKTTLKKRLFAFEAPMRQLPLEQFQRIPVAFYLKAFFDAGYVRSFRSGGPQGPFSDRWIYGTGLGLDVVTYYDTVLRFEYAFARDGEHGFFFSFEKEF